MSVHPTSGLIEWTPSTTQVGSHAVVARVVDQGGLGGTQAFTVAVANTPDAPYFVSTAATLASVGVHHQDLFIARDPDPDDTLVYSVSGPSGMTIHPTTGRLDYTPSAQGTFSVTVTVTDSTARTASQTFALLVVPDDQDPTVTLTASDRYVNAGASVVFVVSATDDASVASTTLVVDGVVRALDGNGQATVLLATPGVVQAFATATDPAGNVGSTSLTLGVQDPGDTEAPTVDITDPVDDQEVTAPSFVVGTVVDNNLVEYTLSHRRGETGNFTVFARSDQNILGSPLGTFDPTLLENGLYTLRLEATDANQQTSRAEITVQVQGGMKVGVFTLSFVDLQIPVSGIPITVTRTYDSRIKSTEDFGVGWTLDVAAGRYSHNRAPGEGWELEDPPGVFTLPCSQVNELLTHRTEVRLSDREWYSFAPTVLGAAPTVGGCTAQMGFTQIGGYALGATLEILGNTYVFQGAGDDVLYDDETLLPWAPQQVVLTTYDGRVVELERGRGVVAVEDLDENRLTIGVNGISSSTGRSITFARDAEGRITTITDPMNHTLSYAYDAAGDLVRFTNQMGNVTDFFYDDGHNLGDIIDPLGVPAVRNEYDETGRLVATIDPSGHRFAFAHDLVNRRETLTNRLGYTTFMDYDLRGNVVLETYPGTPTYTKARTYDSRDNVLSETNEEGETTTWTYDDRNQKLTETNALNETTTWTYSGLGRMTSMTDPRGAVTTWTFDSRGREIGMVDPEGYESRKVYNTRGDLVRDCDGAGHCASTVYNGFGEATRQTNKRMVPTLYTYDANGAVLTQTATRSVNGVVESLVTTYVRDALGRETQVTGPDGAVRQTAFNPRGEVTETTDPLGRITTFEFDAEARRVLTRFPDQTTEEVGYDVEGRMTSRTDRAGRTRTMAYDSRGRMVSSTFDGASTAMVYDGAGRVVETRDRLNHPTTTVYDLAGRVVETRNALNQATAMSYDDAGNLATITDAKNRTTTHTYDDRGLKVRTDHPDSTFETVAYDANGRQIAKTDQEARTTLYTYDGEGNLTSVTNPENETWVYGYDEQNNLVTQTDPLAHTTHFGFDRAGREISRRFHIGPAQTRAYDAAGNLITRINYSGATTGYVYDENNRLVARQQPEGTVTMGYTPTGKRATAVDARGTTVYTYDPSDRLASLTYPNGQSLSYAYDAQGNMTAMTANTGLESWTDGYTFDALNRIATVTSGSLVFGLTYDATGQLETLSYPNGLVTTYTYDDRDRVESITVRNGAAVVMSLEYSWTPAGNVASILEQDGRLTEYGYDDSDRLISEEVSVNGVGESLRGYAYDHGGNRIEVSYTPSSGGSQVQACTVDARDRLLTQGTSAFSWDEDGRLVSSSEVNGFSAGWDSEDRLLTLNYSDGSEAAFTYDVDGVQVEHAFTTPEGSPTRVEMAVDTRTALSHVLAEVSGGPPSSVTRYVRASDLLLAISRLGGPRFFHPDHLGSPRMLSDSTGITTDVYRFTAWGELEQHLGSDPNPYLYAGQRFEPAAGLSYNRARWLAPTTARFLSIDPWSGTRKVPATLVRYSYGNQNPLIYHDPTGRQFSLASVAVAGFITGILSAELYVSLRFTRGTPAEPGTNTARTDAYREAHRLAPILGLTVDEEAHYADAMQHCIASCRVHLHAGGAHAALAGVFQEVINTTGDSAADLLNDHCGVQMAEFLPRTAGWAGCTDSCSKNAQAEPPIRCLDVTQN
jgi:RHS repeat-associated protein